MTASYGVQGFTAEHLEAFKRHGTERVLIAYDRDDAGSGAAEALAEKLKGEGIDCYRIEFPHGMDANEYALKVQPATKSLGLLIRKATWLGKGKRPAVDLAATPGSIAPAALILEKATKEKTPLAAEVSGQGDVAGDGGAGRGGRRGGLAEPDSGQGPRPPGGENGSAEPSPAPIEASPVPAPSAPPAIAAEVKDDEVLVRFGDRRYRVRGLPPTLRLDRLEVNVFVSLDGVFLEDDAEKAGYFVDTFNLYKEVPRARFTKQAAAELGLEEAVIKKDLGRLLLKLEEVQEERARRALEPIDPTPKLSEEETEARP